MIWIMCNKKLLPILILASIVSCTNVDEEISDFVMEEPESLAAYDTSNKRSYEEALSIAKESISMLESSSSGTRLLENRTIEAENVKYMITPSSSTRSSAEIDTLMYIFNFEGNSGFSIVSANKATEGLIAVIEEGSYDPAIGTDNESFQLYMELAKSYIINTEETISAFAPIPGFIEYKAETITKNIENHGPFLRTRWGGNWPYNLYCLNSKRDTVTAGCGPTAIAQILSYYEYPLSLPINYDGVSSTLVLNWATIKKHIFTDLATDRKEAPNKYCEAAHEPIGKLLRQIGKLADVNYDDASGTSSKNIANAFSSLGYKYDGFHDYKQNTIASSLRSGKIVCMVGTRIDGKGRTVGHVWIVDGNKKNRTISTEYKREPGKSWEILNTGYTDTEYNHINWGWNGDCNGYFIASVFDSQKSVELDEGCKNSILYKDFAYPNDLKILYNITVR